MSRLKEPSTWAGIGMLAQLVGSFFPQYAAVAHAVTAVAGAAAIAVKEKGTVPATAAVAVQKGADGG